MDFRLLSYRAQGQDRAGILLGDTIVEASTLFNRPHPATVLDMLGDWDRYSREIATWASGDTSRLARVALSDVELLPPILYPGQIYIAGGNYLDHVKEVANRQPTPKQGAGEGGSHFKEPWHVLKGSRSCVVASGTAVSRPEGCRNLDWEAELAVVIGRRASRVSVKQALDYVAGYTIANDLSARDISRRTDTSETSLFRMDWIRHKSFDGACPLGPWITPAAMIPDPQALSMRLWVNDTLRQDSNTANMIFGVAEQISAISQRTSLYPGDVILTGTPSGTGVGMGVFLQEGDTVRIEIERLGELITPIR